MIPRVSLVVPAHNEGDRLGKFLHDVQPFLPQLHEVIVVLDGCTDNSEAQVRHAQENWPSVSRLIVLPRQPNIGKGGALKWGLGHATGSYALLWDADLEYGLAALPAIVQAATPHTLVSGVRTSGLGWRSRWANRLVRCALRLGEFPSERPMALPKDVLTGVHMAETKWLKYALIGSPPGYGVEAHLVRQALSGGLYIHDLPVPYRARTFDEGRGVRAGDLPAILAAAVGRNENL